MNFYEMLFDNAVYGNSKDFHGVVDRSITKVTKNMLRGLTAIGYSAFNSCASLVSIELPSSLQVIAEYGLAGCTSLTEIDIPASVTEIRSYAFFNSTNLAKVIVRATTPPTLGASGVFLNTASNLSIEVPADSVSAYKTAWSDYADKIVAIGG